MSSERLVVFRLDVCAATGYGHATRCLTLARELVARHAQIVFVIRTRDVQSYEWMRAQGFEVISLPQHANEQAWSPQQQATEFLDALEGYGDIDWLIVDHYGIDYAWESLVRPRVNRIFVIDDLANRMHDCDLLLDQNVLDASENPYADLTPPSATILLGPRYALLRPPFAELHRSVHIRSGEVNRVLVCFGGSDPANHTTAAVDALAALKSNVATTVVIGRSHVNPRAVESACRSLAACELLIAPEDLPERLALADLVIGAGGVMSWERACVGAPSVAVGIAPNQVAVLRQLFEAGCAIGVVEMFEPDVERLRQLISVCLSSPAMLAGMSRRAAALVDGRGVSRVADSLLDDGLTFRYASMSDCESMLRWRNHPSIRGVSLSDAEIDLPSHTRWLQRTIEDPDRILLIAEYAGCAVGVVRFDIQDCTAVISVYRVPESLPRHVGLIQRSVQWLRRNRSDVRRILAEIRADNERSYQAFRSAGFVDLKHELVLEIAR